MDSDHHRASVHGTSYPPLDDTRPARSRGHSLFVAVVSAALGGIFVFVQTIRHRDYFLPHDHHACPEEHALPPSLRQATLSLVFLLVALVAVVGLAKVLSHLLEEFVEAFHLPLESPFRARRPIVFLECVKLAAWLTRAPGIAPAGV
jgi:Ca2+/H+ antiporter